MHARIRFMEFTLNFNTLFNTRKDEEDEPKSGQGKTLGEAVKKARATEKNEFREGYQELTHQLISMSKLLMGCCQNLRESRVNEISRFTILGNHKTIE